MVASFFLGLALHLLASTTNIQANICRTPAIPQVQTPNTATSVSLPQVFIGGSGTANSTIELSVNGSQVATLTTDASGNFGTTVGLNEGQNVLTAVAEDACGDTAVAPSVTITFIPVAPVFTPSPSPAIFAPGPSAVGGLGQSQVATTGTVKLRVYSPKHVTVSGASIQLIGETIANAQITVSNDGEQVAQTTSSTNGFFAVVIPLHIGTNALLVTAVSDSSTAAINLTITRTAAVLSGPQRTLPEWYLGTLAAFITLALLVTFRVRRTKAL